MLLPKPFSSLSQRHHISNDNLCQRDHTSCSNTLQTSPNKHDREIIGHRCDDCTDAEESQGHENQRLSAEDMGERGIARQKDCRSQQE
jgi:hypothetical protein